nr:RNA-directed DNA polymerase, eukaryota [Tanacetum cinerariifolium]
VASWFRRLCNAQSDFAAKERIVWVDVEGVPLNDWSRSTFQKIASKWGEMVELEDGYDDLFTRKRICIKTSLTENILESFKIIVKGKVFWARAKELFVRSPSFKEVPEKVTCSNDESVKINEEANSLNNGVEESDSEVVLDTYFGDNGEDQGLEHQHGESSNAKEVSSDPFNIYGLLDKRTEEVRNTTTSIPYPSGFTHVNENPASIKQYAPKVESDRPPNRSEMSNSRVLEEVANFMDRSSSESINNGIKLKEGGFILEILEEMITVGQTMGFSMEGSKAKKDWIRELISKHKVSFLSIQETKMESVSAMELEGYSFTWAHHSATKMSKLYWFLMSNGLLFSFPHISAICLDRHLSDHRPILLKEVISDFGPTPFRFYHSWLGLPGFDDLVMKSWNSFVLDDSNGDENSKYFHAIINKKRANLSVKGVMVDGDWIDEPDLVKHEFRSHFANRFQDPGSRRGMSINIQKSHLLGDNMSSIKAWDEAISKMKKRLSRWKLNTLSVGGRLALLKSVLGSTPIYNMLIFKEHMAWQTDYCIMKEGMSILRGRKSVPGMNSSAREMERGYYSAFT